MRCLAIGRVWPVGRLSQILFDRYLTAFVFLTAKRLEVIILHHFQDSIRCLKMAETRLNYRYRHQQQQLESWNLPRIGPELTVVSNISSVDTILNVQMKAVGNLKIPTWFKTDHVDRASRHGRSRSKRRIGRDNHEPHQIQTKTE